MNRISFLFICILFPSLFISCTPENGADGIAGLNGINGKDGVNGIDGKSIGLIVETLNSNCNRLIFYYDANNNQTKDSSESIISTLELCNGTNGTNGTNGADGTNGTNAPKISMYTQNAEETACLFGGKVFVFYEDINENGVHDENERIIGSESICNGSTGGIGQSGVDGLAYNMFISQATTAQCSNGGFIVTVYLDADKNGIYDSQVDSITSENIICYPDRATIEFPDYSSLGHTMRAIGVWRLYSIAGIPVDEADRFNIYIYPDELNPSLLTDNGANQSGWLDFKDDKKIGWSYSFTNTGIGYRGFFDFDERKITGLKQDRVYESGATLTYIPPTNETPEYMLFNYPSNYDTQYYDLAVWKQKLTQCVFYRIK